MYCFNDYYLIVMYYWLAANCLSICVSAWLGKGVKDCVQEVNHILVAMLWVKDYSILLSEETVYCDVSPNASLSVLNHTVYVFKEKYLNSCIIFCCYVKSTFNCYNHTIIPCVYCCSVRGNNLYNNI